MPLRHSAKHQLTAVKIMASAYGLMFSTLLVAMYFLPSFCSETAAHRNLTSMSGKARWLAAGATWYGSKNGFGSDGGACGYGTAVGRAPFSSMVSAVSPSLYKAGQGCGVCYQVRCTRYRWCSRKPVTVVITDECPGCLSESVHFDLSGTAIGAMALRGRADQLRNLGTLSVQYYRVPCEYPHKTITFHVDVGSNPSYMAVLIEFEDGDGDLARMELRERGKSTWRPMKLSWGAMWKIDAGSKLTAPLSIRLTSQHSRRRLIAVDVIPAGWKPGSTYRSLVNFN